METTETMKDITLYGAGGHAKVIIDIIRSTGGDVKRIYDDNAEIKDLCGAEVMRPQAVNGPMIISIGSNRVRKIIAERHPVTYVTAIHPTATVSNTAAIGAGSVVMSGVTIEADVHIGLHCIINTGATVNHECEIGDYVHISPNAALCGNVHVGEGTWIGAGATVIPGIRIGRHATIGAGSVVIRDIPDGATAVGNPAKVIKTAE